ncbi:hypothetical protein [Desulfosporosinus sp. SB140]|uniref:hypothetical protein n=1 Tax=Desulfosporosinus paludis TaxID=3115649 RepID=UPI00388F0853
MRRRHYTKHTVYHMIDNLHRNQKSNESCMAAGGKTAVANLRTSKDSTTAKIEYLKDLPPNVYQFRSNNKYVCNLNAADKNYIRSVNDNVVLYPAYFGKTITEPQDDRTKAIISASIILVFFVFFIITIVSNQ